MATGWRHKVEGRVKMDNLISKYYDGYEGEPEIQFIKGCNQGERTIISIWDGFFDDIMRLFEPSDDGWQGLAYYYNLAIGWEDELWEIPDLLSALTEFQSLDSNRLEFDRSSEVLSAICDLLITAINENQKVWMNKE